MNPTPRRPIRQIAALVAALAALAAGGCVELAPLDFDKPIPDRALPSEGQPPPSCGLDSLKEGEEALYFHLIDVGQGDALLIQTPDDGEDGNGRAEGLNILIDAGNLGFGDFSDGARHVSDFLHRLGVNTIDYAIVTHGHADHYGGMAGVFEEFKVINVVDPGYDVDNTSWRAFLTAAAEEVAANGGQHLRPAIGAWVPEVGATVDWGSELRVEVLHASATANLGKADNTRVNNTSVVLKVTYGDVALLLMGDAEEEVEALLLDRGFDLTANILKAGHHGSNTSSTSPFIEAVFRDAPEDDRFAAISSGRVSFSGVQLPTIQTRDRLRRAVDSTHLFSTEHGDSDKTEESAPGDDHVTFVVTSAGQIGACYIY